MAVDGNEEFRNPAGDVRLEADAMSDTELGVALPDLSMAGRKRPQRRDFANRRDRLRIGQMHAMLGTADRVLDETLQRWRQVGGKVEGGDGDEDQEVE